MLSLILKYSSPVSSPATPGLTASPSECKKFEMSRGHKEDSPRRRTPRPGRRSGAGDELGYDGEGLEGVDGEVGARTVEGRVALAVGVVFAAALVADARGRAGCA